jgi:N-methylhydantoinase B
VTLTRLRDGLALRTLSPAAFEATYDCDRFTASVLTEKFDYVIKHMVTQVQRTAFSPIVRDSADLAATIHGPASLGYPMVAVSQTNPLFLGSMQDGVGLALEEYGLERLGPGDVIVTNDYYRIGTHLNDVCFIHPIFSDGRVMGAATIRAHMVDMGGRAPGGFNPTKANTYEDGLVLPPMLLFTAGERVDAAFNLLMANTRFGPLMTSDIMSINAALELGGRLVCEALDRYGERAYRGAIRYACDASAEAMGEALERIPDGDYRAEEPLDCDALDADAEYRVSLRIAKRGHRAEFDFSGSSVAAPSALNCAWPDAKTAVAVALKNLVDRHSRFTSGSLRHVDLVLPPNAFINADPPHACQYYHEVVTTMLCATYQALNPALGEDAVGADSGILKVLVTGTRADGKAWVGYGVGGGLGDTAPGPDELAPRSADPIPGEPA